MKRELALQSLEAIVGEPLAGREEMRLFEDLGFDSLRVFGVGALLARRCGATVRVHELVKARTVRDLVGALEWDDEL